MTRRVFYSFHYDLDNWRVQTVKNIGQIESEPVLHSNQWEEVWRGGEAAVKRWIDRQMEGKSCLVVLVGSQTASRPWVKYEIEKAWSDGRGVLGVRIHKLLDRTSRTSVSGSNPFDNLRLGAGFMSRVAPLKDPAGSDSKAVYASISTNIENWIEEAITARKIFRA